MLKRSMDEIAQCAAKEVSCLGSSLESLHDSEEDFSDQDIQISSEEEHEKKTAPNFCIGGDEDLDQDATLKRELKNPLSVFLRSRSDCKGNMTPPYLSPGITRRLQPSLESS